MKAATVGLAMLTATAIFTKAVEATKKQLGRFGRNVAKAFAPYFKPIGNAFHQYVTRPFTRYIGRPVTSFYHRATRWVSSGVRHTVQRARNFYRRTVSAVRRGFSRARRFVRRIFRRRR